VSDCSSTARRATIPLSDLHGKARVIYWSRDRRYPDPRNPWHYEAGGIRWDRMGVRLD